LYWRNTKESIKDQYQLPTLTEDLVLLDLTDFEKALYADCEGKQGIKQERKREGERERGGEGERERGRGERGERVRERERERERGGERIEERGINEKREK
jgi:hypothetical protein